MGYDIIGDIHGQFSKLTDLLTRLGYSNTSGVYKHPTRKALFLGDFIDRGPQQKAVLSTVMAMVGSGSARAVMGNHEYNALALHNEDPERPGTWLRPRTDRNLSQHIAFLNEYIHCEDELQQALAFFKSLPLWLDLEGLRLVHACWDAHAMAVLEPILSSSGTLTDEALVATSRKGSAEYDALETVIKGPEIALPSDAIFVDRYGIKRRKMRLCWWGQGATSLRDNVVDRGHATAHLDQLPPEPVLGYAASEKPVFIGHYWLKAHPEPLLPNLACLDYSAASSGPLVAYRWSGEQQLRRENFVASTDDLRKL